VTLVERKTAYVVIGKLARRTARKLNLRLAALVRRQPHAARTITADNGTEFHSYRAFEARVTLKFYFATPHHAWERGPTRTGTASFGSPSRRPSGWSA
jgi:transposase, IS30 family